MASSLDLKSIVDENTPRCPITIEPYLQKVLESSTTTDHPPSLLDNLNPTKPNKIFLFAGLYNPPHLGHLATIQYFSRFRTQLAITAFFIFADPSPIIATKNKKYGSIILPQDLHNRIFANVPEITELITQGWLHILVGDMEGHITVLREMTDSISRDHFEARLVGFLGGDKLSIENPPHLPPGDLDAWGPVDDFFIMNARRPVDFYDLDVDDRLHDLPGCSEWKRGDCLVEEDVGAFWVCRALTVARKPLILFRVSRASMSTGVGSTKIRSIMMEASRGEVYARLKDQVLSIGFLVEWLEKYGEAEKTEVGNGQVWGRFDSGVEI